MASPPSPAGLSAAPVLWGAGVWQWGSNDPRTPPPHSPALFLLRSDALEALQSASICSGLPYTFYICLMCTCLWRALAQHEDPHPTPNWKFAMLDGVFEFVFSLFLHPFPELHYFVDFVVAAVCPMWPLMGILTLANKDQVAALQM